MSWIRMVIGSAAFVGIASVAGAQAPQGGGAPQQGMAQQGGMAAREARMAKRLFAGIELTEAQNAQIQKISEKYGAERQALMPAAAASGGFPQLDDAARAKMMDITTRSEVEYRAILSTSQQKIFDANVAEIKARMQQRQKQQ
jgi:LTXXQ motif family protein